MLDRLRQFFGSRPHGDSILTAHLMEALEYPGCPICRLVTTGILRGLTGLLYECVNDAQMHRELLASRGFCTEHTWSLPVAEASVHSPTGVATIYERLLADLLRHADSEARLADWLCPETACPVCVSSVATADAYLAELARLLVQSPRLDGQSVVLCLPHLRASACYTGANAQAWLGRATEAALGRRSRGQFALRVGHRPAGAFLHIGACLVCQAANEASDTVPDVTALCRQHAWTLLARGRREVVETVCAAVPEDQCVACQAAAEAVEVAIDQLDDAAMLCLGHLRLAGQRGWQVRKTVLGALERLDADLLRFRDSADYSFTGTLSAAEQRSWLTVLARFGGEAVGASVARQYPFAQHQESEERSLLHHSWTWTTPAALAKVLRSARG